MPEAFVEVGEQHMPLGISGGSSLWASKNNDSASSGSLRTKNLAAFPSTAGFELWAWHCCNQSDLAGP